MDKVQYYKRVDKGELDLTFPLYRKRSRKIKFEVYNKDRRPLGTKGDYNWGESVFKETPAGKDYVFEPITEAEALVIMLQVESHGK